MKAIEVRDLGKLYRLGEVGTGTISHDLNRFWHRVRNKPDPYARVGESNVRHEKGGDYVWALKNLSLDLDQGEVLGVIGKNGAGKSTVLKLLSRVTAPTTGSIRARGRMASLLEVGTGFHPELTGRENIFLNGAILGMPVSETKSRFDEIVDFSGCARYIDTPVKRYSSGMYVRLAFAVAAHLDPDILIVDEVLAVGDAEFQDRCVGKMQEVSQEQGRTILFVSHNMAAVRKLCPRSILLEDGQEAMRGSTPDVIERYLSGGPQKSDRVLDQDELEAFRTGRLTPTQIAIRDENGSTNSPLSTDSALTVEVSYKLNEPVHNLRVVVTLTGSAGINLFSSSDLMAPDLSNYPRESGHYVSRCSIPPMFLNQGRYSIWVDFEVPLVEALASQIQVPFEVADLAVNQLGQTFASPPGALHPLLEWTIDTRPDTP